ncbi:MAG: hypothetical protein JWM58_2344 [Rhizobium sp.]|nr:hypothetical protein [Rhizobium sp.]
MALIDNQANEIDEIWSYPDAADAPVQGLNYIVPWDVFTSIAAGSALERPAGVLVGPEVAPEQIASHLELIDLIVVQFPKFRDGRGFSTARALRQRHGFRGDIRALGHVLPDQLPLLSQCGFSSIVTPGDHPPPQWKATLPGQSLPERPQQLLRRLVKRDLQAPRNS